MSRYKIVIVGQNTARASKSGKPFEGTRSGKILDEWLALAGLRETLSVQIIKVNICDYKTDGNRALTTAEIKKSLPSLAKKIEKADLIISLGKQSRKALEMCAYLVEGKIAPSIDLEHPSGLNRNLNDPKVREAQHRRIRMACQYVLGI